MASQAQDLTDNSSDMGQPQLRRDDYANHASHISQQVNQSQHSSYKAQATNFLQQTGEQMKNMAQGAASAMKNTLGMNSDNTPNRIIDNPTYPSHPTIPTNPSNNRI